MFSIVSRTNFMSLRLAPSTANPIGTPCPSVKRLCFAPFSPVGGVTSRILTTQRRFGHGSIHAQPSPVYPFQLIETLHPDLPKLQKDACFFPFLETIMCGGTRNQVGMIQRFPLASCPQNIEDGVSTFSVWDTRTPSTKAMSVDMDWQQRLKYAPQFIRDAEVCGGFVIRRALALAFGCAWWLGHMPSLPVIRIGSKHTSWGCHLCDRFYFRIIPKTRGRERLKKRVNLRAC